MAYTKFLALAGVAAMFYACGDDSSSNKVTEPAEGSDIIANTFDDLLVCTDKREGAIAYVKDEKAAYVCEGGDWTLDADKSSSSLQGKKLSSSSSSIRLSSSAKFSSSLAKSSSSSITPKSSSSVTRVSSNSIRSSSSAKSSSSLAKSFFSSVTPKSSSSVTRVSSSSIRSSSSAKSSSSLAKSSSSSVSLQSSSSSPSVSSSKASESAEGTLTDTRDGQTYKTVSIGSQTWMAENLNYAYIGVPYNSYSVYTSDSTSWCYGNEASNCTKYGRLYTWAAAMDSVGTWSANGKGCGDHERCTPTYPVRGVCPEGWHMPSQEEWNVLLTAVGGQLTAGKMLKSTSGWYGSGNGSDAYAFSALPAGNSLAEGGYYNEGDKARFWSSTEYDRFNASHLNLDDYALLGVCDKNYGFSVRCLKD